MEVIKASLTMSDVVKSHNVSKTVPGLKLRNAYLNQSGDLVLVFLDAGKNSYTVSLTPAMTPVINSGEVVFKPNEKNVEAIIEDDE